MKIGLATKLSKLDWDCYRLNMKRDAVIEIYKRQEKDVDKILASHNRQNANIEDILRIAPDAEKVDMLDLQKNPKRRPDLDMLLVMGGDNFFQIAAHHFPYAYLIGVNSDPQTSHGALLNYTPESLIENLPGIIEGHFQTEYWTKIETKLNGKMLEDAGFTISLSIKATDMMSRFYLKRDGLAEEQKATGILVVTGAGTGKGSWYRNSSIYLPAVGYDMPKEIERDDRKLKTLTREPMGGVDCPYQGLNMTIGEDDELNLMYWANDPSELSLDSIKRYDVFEGDRLSFRVSDRYLKVIR